MDCDFEENDYAPSRPFPISDSLVTGCAASRCTKSTNLSRCAACKVVFYCSREHQASHRPEHKPFCTIVKKAQAELDQEEAALRAHPGDAWTRPNPFETGVGHFWGILATRDYMRTRNSLAHALFLINTRAAVQKTLDHVLDLLRLCRSDNMGVRDLPPSLYLRLGRDQECYDYCKWWVTTALRRDYDWGNTDLPYLDLKGEDAFESVSVFVNDKVDLTVPTGVMLLKIRLLIDLQTLRRATREVGPRLPRELVDKILQYSATTSIVRDGRNIREQANHTPRIEDLKKQIRTLYEHVRQANKHFWPALLNPDYHLTQQPMILSKGSVGDMQVKLQYCYNAWMQTPGAIGVIQDLTKVSAARPGPACTCGR